MQAMSKREPHMKSDLHPIAAAVMTALGMNSAAAATGNIQLTVNYPNLSISIPAGITSTYLDLLVVPRGSPLPSHNDMGTSAFTMTKGGGSYPYTANGTTVTPVLGGGVLSCPTQCTLNLNIPNPTQTGNSSGAYWYSFVDGNYDLLVQNSQGPSPLYSVPFYYGSNVAPVASNVSIAGTAREGLELTGQYAFSDAENDPEDTSSFRWVRNNVNSGVAGGTTVASTLSYRPLPTDVGNYLYFCVTPAASTGAFTGSEVCSSATTLVDNASTGNIQVAVNHPNLSITIPPGITTSYVDLLIVPAGSPLPSHNDMGTSAFTMTKGGGSYPYTTNGTTVTPVLGGGVLSCPTQCTFNLNIPNPTQTGNSSGTYWYSFVEGNYRLLVQNSQGPSPIYSVPFTYVANTPPVASQVSIAGTVREGSALTGGYTFSDADNNPEGASSFRWVRHSVATGVIGGTTVASNLSYTPVQGDVGNYLYFCVTPIAAVGSTTGIEVCSAASAAVAAAPINGSCGTASNTATAFIPTANLCTAGSASPVTTGSSSWGWSCNGAHGGTAASCSAPFASVPGGGSTVGIIQAASTNNWQVRTADSGFVSLPAAAPAGVNFPIGATKVVLDAGTPGSSATVTLRFSDIPAGAKLYKYGKETGIGDSNKWFEYPATIDFNAKTVTYTLTDGQKGDNDWVANGVINDPVALGLSSSSASVAGIPTLSEWGLMMLSALMALGTFGAMRRRTR
jgi:hypothetical protein